ncbi:MAG: aspartyl protease family protein [Patescibacteria group bacterium]
MKHAFTTDYSGRARVLYTKVGVCVPSTPQERLNNPPIFKEYNAIWDTGATNSAITKKVVNNLKLSPSGIAESRHADGKSLVNTYLVSISLPNKVLFEGVRVSEVKLIPDDNQKEEEQPQLLIGMDIISMGDFAVTTYNGKTALSFRMPSSERINFIPNANMSNIIEAKKNKQPAFIGKKR